MAVLNYSLFLSYISIKVFFKVAYTKTIQQNTVQTFFFKLVKMLSTNNISF